MDYEAMGDQLVRYAEVTSLLMKSSAVQCFDASYAQWDCISFLIHLLILLLLKHSNLEHLTKNICMNFTLDDFSYNT